MCIVSRLQLTILLLVISQAVEHLSQQRLRLPRVVEVVDVLLEFVQGARSAMLEFVLDLGHLVLLMEVHDLRDVRRRLLGLSLVRSALLMFVVVTVHDGRDQRR